MRRVELALYRHLNCTYLLDAVLFSTSSQARLYIQVTQTYKHCPQQHSKFLDAAHSPLTTNNKPNTLDVCVIKFLFCPLPQPLTQVFVDGPFETLGTSMGSVLPADNARTYRRPQGVPCTDVGRDQEQGRERCRKFHEANFFLQRQSHPRVPLV